MPESKVTPISPGWHSAFVKRGKNHQLTEKDDMAAVSKALGLRVRWVSRQPHHHPAYRGHPEVYMTRDFLKRFEGRQTILYKRNGYTVYDRANHPFKVV